MNIVTLIFDQEGVSLEFHSEVDSILNLEEEMMSDTYEEVWKDEMTRVEFDEYIASEWTFDSYEVKENFKFNGYKLVIDGEEVWSSNF